MEALKAISVRQPYAQLIALGEKKLETRSRRTFYRGRIAIQAGKSPNPFIYGYGGDQFLRVVAEGLTIPLRRDSESVDDFLARATGDLPRGAIVAVGELVEC
jgi:hypothetical protein